MKARAPGPREQRRADATRPPSRRHGELDLLRINRALKMLSACNEALIRAQHEQQLLAEICRIAVDIGGYRMAWVGYALEGPGRSIVPMASAGDESGLLAQIGLSWAVDTPGGAGPAARAICGSEVIVVADLAADPTVQPWRAMIERRGYRGLICLPLLGNERTFGVLGLFADTVEPLRTDEVKLLQEMADNLAFGIGNIRAGVETRQLQDAVLKIAQGVSAGSGAAFFDLLTRSLVEALQADGGMVARLAGQGRPAFESLSLVLAGELAGNVTQALVGSAAEAVIGAELCVFERGVQERFPHDPMLRELGLESYAGIHLRDMQGRSLGLLAVFFGRRMTRPALAASALRIFAARAASEMERQVAEVSLGEQASLLDKAHDAIVVRGIDDRIRLWNRGAERMFGWARTEALGRTIEELLCDDPECLHEAIGGVMDSGEWNGELEHRRRDGARLTVAAHWTLVRDDAGRPRSILCICTDITRRLAMERQLQQSQRLEAVGQLTGGVAHDFNNLLTVILGNSELLAERLAGDARLHLLADMIRGAAQRGADLTNRLLAFARRQALEPRAVDTDQLLAGMEGLLRRTLREDIDLIRVAGAQLWQALVDPAQLEGAVLNLCINARDAMAGGGKLIVETANVILDQDYAAQNPEVRPGEYVRVAVSDTGQGIAPENLKRVFEPFFTTKEFGKGTGLGLSMVYGFVKQSQGHVTIYSEVGQGTTVKMYLPRADRPADVPPEPARSIADLHGTEKVLLAEDDDLVRRYAAAQLAGLGYRVVAVVNGAEALEYLKLHDDVALLFTDVVMPGSINGPELAEAACRLRPELKVLFTSGYTDNAIAQHGRFGSGLHLLSKPYRRIELAQKVRAALSQVPA
ncbi:MAG TPA: ATP-binding protein [Solimonas sp.]|nr:ATP-binding protein [Solimonas sp.]